jgi:hypothetical protein
VTDNDIRDFSVQSFGSDKTKDIESFRNNFDKRLKNDYRFEVGIKVFASNIAGKFRHSICNSIKFKELVESLLVNRLLENTILKPLTATNGRQIGFSRDYRRKKVETTIFPHLLR